LKLFSKTVTQAAAVTQRVTICLSQNLHWNNLTGKLRPN